MYAPSNVYGPSRMYEHPNSLAHHPPSVYHHHHHHHLPFPVSAHVKSPSSSSPEFPIRNEKHHHRHHHHYVPPAAASPRQYYRYAITDVPTKTVTSSLCTPFVGVPLIEIAFAALQTLFCFLYIITGQAILRAAHLDGYSPSISSSVKVGAVGGAAMTLPAIFFCIHKLEGPVFALWSIAVDTLIGAMAGPIGVAILAQRLREKLLDPLHAARAGALGACIISTGLHILRRF